MSHKGVSNSRTRMLRASDFEHAQVAPPEPVLNLQLSLQRLSTVAKVEILQRKYVRPKNKIAATKLVSTAREITAAVAAACQQRPGDLPILAKSHVLVTQQFMDECATYIQSRVRPSSVGTFTSTSTATQLSAFVLAIGILRDMLVIENGAAQLVLDPACRLGLSDAKPELVSPRLSAQCAGYHGVKVVIQALANMTEGLMWPWKAIPQTVLQFIKMVESSHRQPQKFKDLLGSIGARVSFLVNLCHRKGRKNQELCNYVLNFLCDIQRIILRLRITMAVHPAKQFPLTSKIDEIIVEESAGMQAAVQRLQNNFTAVTAFTVSAVEEAAAATQAMVAGIEVKVAGIEANLEEIHAKVVGQNDYVDVVQGSLPGRPHVFNGRDGSVNELVEIISLMRPARIVIMGAGGIGKTSLALAIAHDDCLVADFGDRRFFVSVEGMIDVESTAKELGKTLGLQVSTDPLSAVVRHLRSSPPTLLVIDNLETLLFINNAKLRIKTEQMLTRLADIGSLTLIVTSRGAVPPGGVQWSNLGSAEILPISLDAAQQTFGQIAGWPVSEEEQAALDTLLREMDCMPLAVTLLARLALRKNSPSELLRRWSATYTRFIQTPGNHRECSVDVSIRVSLDLLTAMDYGGDGLQLLSMCSYLPDGLRRPVFKQVSGSFENIDAARDLLVEFSLVSVGAEGELKTLSPVRHFMLTNHPLGSNHLVLLRSIYFKIALSGPRRMDEHFTTLSKNIAPEYGNLKSFLLRLIHSDELSDNLCNAVHALSEYAYWTVPSLTLLKQLRDRLEGQSARLARCLVEISRTQIIRGEYEVATKHLRRARSLYDLENPEGAARSTYYLGYALARQGKWADGELELNAAQAIFIERGNKLGVARSALRLGYLHSSINRHDRAIVAFSSALDIFRPLGERHYVARCTHGLGWTRLRMNDLTAAEKSLQTALLEYKALGNVCHATQCTTDLGALRLRQKQLKLAETLLVTAHEASIQSGLIGLVARCIYYLACLRRDQGKTDEARASFQQALEKYETLGRKSKVEACRRGIEALKSSE
ncbi:hypothetical protein BKA62DRAFT_833577 [Auriculariales sp. MPI-PUGE-AT-0066]|nr:hypothetical protein BKA62DRAFT_833577 [Auriculariales sp. MPI-PUGE-AT-0066]